ncbi:hypothetical protein [Synechococcus sp. PROS-7-1]|uniref:hypothetical protein n=1 Tax=Synechococcus sp. PROS-7-1 TaxID=1442556 RepID=UPI0016451113|nr:hypothetical protein [Synechococcus sp. PROS-7-1]
MSFWQEWSGSRPADHAPECFDEEVGPLRDQWTSSMDQVDSRQFLTWEDLIGQR